MRRLAFATLLLGACIPPSTRGGVRGSSTPPQYAQVPPLPGGGTTPVVPPAVRPDPAHFPFAEVVVVQHEEGLRHVFDAARSHITTRHWFRQVVYVRTEGGLSTADVRIALGRDGRLLQVAGRTYKPDGRAVQVAREEMIEEEVLQNAGEPPFRRVLFAIPEVEIGDLVETLWEVETDEPLLFSTFELPMAVPVLQASFWIATGRGFTVHTRASPGLAVSVVPEGTDGVVHRADGGPFLPEDPEPLAPDTVGAPPRFTFSIPEAQLLGEYVALIRTWGDVLEALGEDAYTYFAAATLPLAPLPDLTATAKALYEWSRDQLADAPSQGGGGPRRWDVVAREHRATARERVFYLQALLRNAGIDARFALVRDRRRGELESGIVDPEAIDGLLLYLPSPLGGGTFLAPNCEGCAYGDLPWWFQGVATIVGTGYAADESLQTTLVPTPVLPSLASRRNLRARVTLSESGDADVDLVIRLEGVDASDVRYSVRARGGDERARHRVAAALVDELCPRVLVRTVAIDGLGDVGAPLSVRVTGHARGLAARARGRLVVPLSPFSRVRMDPLAGSARRDPVDVPFEERIDDETTFVLPAGFELLDAPAATTTQALGGQVESDAPVVSGREVRRTLRVVLPRVSLPPDRVAELRPLYASYLAASNAMAIVGSRAPAR